MSKKVVTFLLVLFATTFILMLIIKKVERPAPTDEAAQTQVEAPTSGSDSMSDDGASSEPVSDQAEENNFAAPESEETPTEESSEVVESPAEDPVAEDGGEE